MDTSLFEYFLVLAETLNYTKAANELFKSESVLSRQIAKLEFELGIKLFERNKRAVSLTPAGKTLKKGLISIGGYYTSLVDEAKAIQAGYSGVINIAAPSGVMLHPNMINILMSFEKFNPNIRINLRTYSLGELRTLLLDQQIDFAYGTTKDFTDNPTFYYNVVGHAKIYLIMPKEYIPAKKDGEKLSLADFKNETFIFIADHKPAINSFIKKCEEAGFSPKYITAEDDNMLMLWVAMKRGIALMGETNKFERFKELAIISLPEMGYLELGIIQNTKNLKACNAVFSDYVREINTKTTRFTKRQFEGFCYAGIQSGD